MGVGGKMEWISKMFKLPSRLFWSKAQVSYTLNEIGIVVFALALRPHNNIVIHYIKTATLRISTLVLR